MPPKTGNTVPERRYAFAWEFLGDPANGRPNLGNTTRIEAYRIFHYTMRDILEQIHGTEGCDRIMYRAGELAGKHFCEKFVGRHATFDSFATAAQKALLDMRIGILKVEKADTENASYTITVAEDLDCSGLPDLDKTLCTYDEGFLAGMLFIQTGKEFEVREIDCWCTGDRTCRFEARSKNTLVTVGEIP